MIDRDNILIVLPYLSLLFIGLIMVASSSVYVSEDIYGTPFHFASRQIIFFIIAVPHLEDLVHSLFTFPRSPKMFSHFHLSPFGIHLLLRDDFLQFLSLQLFAHHIWRSFAGHLPSTLVIHDGCIFSDQSWLLTLFPCVSKPYMSRACCSLSFFF